MLRAQGRYLTCNSTNCVDSLSYKEQKMSETRSHQLSLHPAHAYLDLRIAPTTSSTVANLQWVSSPTTGQLLHTCSRLCVRDTAAAPTSMSHAQSKQHSPSQPSRRPTLPSVWQVDDRMVLGGRKRYGR